MKMAERSLAEHEGAPRGEPGTRTSGRASGLAHTTRLNMMLSRLSTRSFLLPSGSRPSGSPVPQAAPAHAVRAAGRPRATESHAAWRCLVFLLLLWRCTTLRLVAQDHVTLDFGARAEGLSRSSARPNLAVAEADLAVAALQASRPVAPRGQNE